MPVTLADKPTPASVPTTPTSADILLVTLNARYSHSSLGLRYLYANLDELQTQAAMLEFTISARAIDIVERLLERQPRIIGFGIYIWNRRQTLEVLALLKRIKPETCIIAGGPEVTHDLMSTDYIGLVDHLIAGEADFAFRDCCRAWLADTVQPSVIHAGTPQLADLELPYQAYTDEDIRHRVIYVEASRGCPFRCEFCLSSLDQQTRPFETSRFLAELLALFERGARTFKFVDRTFNLRADTCEEILSFFLQRVDAGLFLHFEMIPDRLPETIRKLLPQFPAGTIQLEVGIQSMNPTVQSAISRRQNNQRTLDNLQWLKAHTGAHVHADLIIGLPGETLESIASGFDQLVHLQVAEIQVGMLKLLPGTPLIRHVPIHDMRFATQPPYQILSNDTLDFPTICRLNRFARYWDLLANSGHFPATLPLLLSEQPFHQFLAFSDWLWETSGQTQKLSIRQLSTYISDYAGVAQHCLSASTATIKDALAEDQDRHKQHEHRTRQAPRSANPADNFRSRQRRHLQTSAGEL